MFVNFVILLHSMVAVIATGSSQKPHIVLIVADDLGWNDVGFHGSNEIPTPNIDALAYNGLILNRHYTQSACTPSRAALLTGKYPIRMGLQGSPIGAGVAKGVPLREKLLPKHLKDLGYQTALIGKWHMGSFKKEYTPNERGFDSFFGAYNGWIRYNDSVCGSESGGNMSGIDAHANFEKAGDRFKGRYTTDVFTEEAMDVIRKHNRSLPLFLDLSYTAVHAIPWGTMQVRNITETEQRFAYIKDPNRRLLAGALTTLDESVGKVIQALHAKKMLKNAVVVFISDNGGPTFDAGAGTGIYQNYASNWPLRGMKGSLSEGAIRCVAAIWSPLIRRREVLQEKMHLIDWLPTFYAAAGGNASFLGKVDGVSHWEYLKNSEAKSFRNRFLANINEVTDERAFVMGKWKYIKTKSSIKFKYGGYSGRDKELTYNLTSVLQSPVHKVLKRYKEKKFNEKEFLVLRKKADISAQGSCVNRSQAFDEGVLPCLATGCLFNIKKDPCEMVDLSALYPNVVENLRNAILKYEKQMVPQQNCTKDYEANPKYFGNYWMPWMKTQSTCVK